MRKVEKISRRRTIILVANGGLDRSYLSEIRKGDFIIGIDRAAYWLITNGIIPNLAVGDFDSVTDSEFKEIQKKCQVKKYPPEKDWTDLELAVQEALGDQTTYIIVYGATGSRFDHTLAAVRLLETIEKAGVTGVIKDKNNEIRLVSQKTVFAKVPDFKYLSIIPVGASATVTLTGFRYNANKLKIKRNQTIGISNEIGGKEATIIPHQGKILVIRSRD